MLNYTVSLLCVVLSSFVEKIGLLSSFGHHYYNHNGNRYKSVHRGHTDEKHWLCYHHSH